MFGYHCDQTNDYLFNQPEEKKEHLNAKRTSEEK